MQLGCSNQQQYQKQIYDFLTSANRNIALPIFFKEISLGTVEIVFNDLLPMLLTVNVGLRQKQLISSLLQTLFLQHSKLRQEFQSEASLVKSKLTVLNHLISLPNHYVNLISQPKLSQERIINVSNVQRYKWLLYVSILEMAQHLDIDSRLLVINRLLVLGYHKIILEYFLTKNMYEFILLHISAFSKLKNLLAALYQYYVTQQQLAKYRRQDLKKLLIDLANHSFDLTQQFVSLMNLDLRMHKQGRYRQYFAIIHKTKLECKIFENLLKWWAISKTYIITEMHSKVRCNILYLFILNWSKKELVDGDFMVSIIEGIKRKLTDGASKSQALLIWKAISQKMDLPKTPQVENSREFQIVVEKQLQVSQNIGQLQGMSSNELSKSKIHLKEEQSLRENEHFQQKREKIQQLKYNAQKTVEETQYKSSSSSQDESGQPQSIVIRPKNIYDCILSLKNASRQKIALEQLPFLIRNNNQDLILMWNSLLQQLLSPLKEQYRQIMIILISKRPEEFVQSVSGLFMTRETNIGQKIQLILILIQGIEHLSSLESIQEKEEENQNFYFKKVRSRYLKQSQTSIEVQEKQRRIQEKSRRWGYTRIQHQKKHNKQVNLNIIASINSLNRFYPVANLIFYRIIEIFSADIINSLRKHQIFVQHLLRLLAVFTSNIKNHFEKQILLTDICCYCVKIVQELVSGKEAKRYEESGGQTLMLCLQVVNKVALVLDKYTNESVMGSLKQIVEGARKLPNYGMNSILDLIQANIYRNVYGLGQN